MESSSYTVDDKEKSSQTNGGKANEGNILAFLQKAKIEWPCDLAIPFLSTDTKVPKKIQTFVELPEVITKTKKVKIHQIVH